MIYLHIMQNKLFYNCLFYLTVCAILLTAFKTGQPQKIKIVFIGDSITQGSDNPALQPSVYALKYLEQKLKGTTINQANVGVSGKTTVDFLPSEVYFKNTIKAADEFYKDNDAQLAFSIMLGTNDSAVKGPNGSPVSAKNYNQNLITIVDSLLKRYPNCKIVIHDPIWYSINTYNGSMYLAEGLARLQSYFPQIELLVKKYQIANPNHVFTGDKAAFKYFETNYIKMLKPEQGRQGIFYLHPNEQGALRLGEFWGKALNKALSI
jgi:lysophospholipase L1-like esterase